MKILKNRLVEYGKTHNIRLDVLQQDYLLSWILQALSEQSSLKDTLVFKGGTALKKCYFGNYRFSEDLDFSAIDETPRKSDLFKALKQVTSGAESLMNEVAEIRLFFERYEEKSPHPHHQEAFIIRAQYPWQREPLTKIMLEITFAEEILTPVVEKRILHPYGEFLEGVLSVYSLEEIVTEKLRALLENAKKIHEKGWARSRVRDYYDLHHITTTFGQDINWQLINSKLLQKCLHKSVTYTSGEDFFDPAVLRDAQIQWDKWLDHLTSQKLSFSMAIGSLKETLTAKLD